MKKMLFGLIATSLISFAGNAQTKLTTEQLLTVNKQMVVLVDNAKDYLTKNKGASIDQFVFDATGSKVAATKEGQSLLTKVYAFAANSATSDVILKNYDGKEVIAVVQLAISKNVTGHEASNLILGLSSKDCGFWCQLWHQVVGDLLDLLSVWFHSQFP